MKPLLMIPHPHKERHEEKTLALPDHENMGLVGQLQDDRF
jgi:hypothetical protein